MNDRGYLLLTDGSKEYLPEGIKVLDGFAKREDIKAVHLPNSVELIGEHCFDNCSNLETVTCDKENSRLQHIGSHGFYWCGKLLDVTFPNALTTIGDWAFCGSRIHLLDLRNTKVVYMGPCAFMHSVLQWVYLPSTLHVITENCFTCCSLLQSVETEGSIMMVEHLAFDACRSLRTAPKMYPGAKIFEMKNEVLLDLVNN
jgi:hypothetical protein